MRYKIKLLPRAKEDYTKIKRNTALEKRYKAVRKALKLLSEDPKYPGLNTHKYSALNGPNGEEIFEAYAENNTAGAYRIFWHYGSDKEQITIIAITPHP